jgi:predicted exporter
MGGYSSFRRRMTRLGHISFWGLGFVNMMFAFSVRAVEFRTINTQVSSVALIVGLITMPLCCFLTAWRKSFRCLFPIPVISVLVGVASLLIGWAAK